jgi:hypothetical protein
MTPTEAMTDEEMRIAIAEACGWKLGKCGPINAREVGCLDSEPYWIHPDGRRDHGDDWQPPDFLNSLDAMHEAEETLTDEKFDQYDEILWCDVDAERKGTRAYLSADARTRATAFLKTIEK